MLYFYITLTNNHKGERAMKDSKKKSGNKVWTADHLPNGKTEGYLKEHKEWPRLENRLGQPRIKQHYYTAEVLEWIKQTYSDQPDNFSYLEAGCGHGNDLRELKKTLGGRGNFLGINLSRAEISRGLKFYRQEDREDSVEAIKMFGLGNLHNLHKILTWDEIKKSFSRPKNIGDEEFDLVYMEAVLHALGYGHGTYRSKKESAQHYLGELSRVCKTGGKFLGRITAFAGISQSEQFTTLRTSDNWRFIPESDEFIAMLRKAGFDNIKRVIRPHEKSEVDLNKKNMIKISFLAEKIGN